MVTISTKTEVLDPLVDQTALIPLAAYKKALSEKKWYIFLLTAVAVITTLLIIKVQATYRASVTVVLSSTAAQVFNSQTAVEQIIKSDNALLNIINKAGVEYSPGELKSRISVEPVTGTSLINIIVVDSQGKRAKKIADTVGAEFVKATKPNDIGYAALQSQVKIIKEELQWLNKLSGQDKKGTAGSPLAFDIQNVETQINETKTELARVENLPMDPTNKGLYRFLLNQRLLTLEERKPNIIDQRLAILAQQQQLISLGQSLATELDKDQATRVLAPASTPNAPITPNLAKSVILAAVAGLLGGVALIIGLSPRVEGEPHL